MVGPCGSFLSFALVRNVRVRRFESHAMVAFHEITDTQEAADDHRPRSKMRRMRLIEGVRHYLPNPV